MVQFHPTFMVLIFIIDLNYICLYNLAFKVNCVAEIHLTKVYKIVFSFKRFYRLFHDFNVKVIFNEKVLI